jgi:hypothetical protein
VSVRRRIAKTWLLTLAVVAVAGAVGLIFWVAGWLGLLGLIGACSLIAFTGWCLDEVTR